MTREEFIRQMCMYGMKEENAIKFWEGARSEPFTCEGCDTNTKDAKGKFNCGCQYECRRSPNVEDFYLGATDVKI